MPESLVIGKTTCDYLRVSDFMELCQQALQGDHFYHVVTLNPEMVMQTETNAEFQAALARASLRVPDGAGLVWARWYLRSNFWSLIPSLLAFPFVAVERVSGVDAVTNIAALANQEKKSIYLLGGTPRTNKRTVKKLQRLFPDLSIHAGPDHTFALESQPEILADINAKQPTVLFVAYGSPQQTLWLDQNAGKLPSVRLAVGVGGAFAIISEDLPRAPKWLRKLNLEWLWRLILEPRRLGRIWQATVKFPQLIQRQRAANSSSLTW